MHTNRAVEPSHRRGMQRVTFSNPDIQYLTRRNQVEPRFVGRMLRIFGEGIVLEALRRFEKGRSTAVFVGIARKVEREREA